MEQDQVIFGEIGGLLHEDLLNLGGNSAPLTALFNRKEVATIRCYAHQRGVEVADLEHHPRVFIGRNELGPYIFAHCFSYSSQKCLTQPRFCMMRRSSWVGV